MCGERVIRFSLKVLQFLISGFVVYCLFRTGPHWMLTLACLIVPPFGIYLMLKSPDQTKHKLPHRIYWAVAKGKSWLRVDVTICLTMSVVFFGFAIILFYAFFKLLPQNVYLLFAGIASLVITCLYLINAFVSVSQLRSGTVDFSTSILKSRVGLPKVENFFSKGSSVTPTSTEPTTKTTPDELIIQVDQSSMVNTNRRIDNPKSLNYQSSNFSFSTFESPSNKPSQQTSTFTKPKITTHYPITQQDFYRQQSGPEMDQKIIDYIRDELDESLDREYGALVNTRIANNCADNANMNASNRSSKKSAQHYRYAPTRMIVHPMQQQSSDPPYFREPIVSHQQFHRQQQYQQFSDDTTSSTASVSAEQIHPRFPPATLPKPSYEKHQSSPSPPALPKKPPPFMSKSESEEIRRIAQFNEGFVASQQQLQQRASTSRDVDGRRSAFKGLTPNPSNTQKMTDNSSGNAEIERNEAKNADKNDNIVCAAPVGQRSRRFATKSTEPNSGRRRYPRADDASNLRVQRIENKSSEDEDSTSVSMSGSLGSAVHDYENSTTLERSNSDLAMLSRMVSANEQRAANQRNQVLTTSSDANATPTTTTTSTSNHSSTVQYNRQSSRRSSTPPNAYMKRAYRRYSNESQFLNYGFVESDDEILTSRKHSNTLPSAHLSALTHHLSDSSNNDNNGRFDAEFLPPIVASIDSSRESIIARNNSPRRTSSRAKKMYGKRGFDVVIRTQSESDISDNSRNNTKKPSVIHERPVDAFYVTEF